MTNPQQHVSKGSLVRSETEIKTDPLSKRALSTVVFVSNIPFSFPSKIVAKST
jgi:hypothetical protein